MGHHSPIYLLPEKSMIRWLKQLGWATVGYVGSVIFARIMLFIWEWLAGKLVGNAAAVNNLMFATPERTIGTTAFVMFAVYVTVWKPMTDAGLLDHD